jgi:hypothetical protein
MRPRKPKKNLVPILFDDILSEQWIQIGVTFIPIPHDLRGRKKEIEAEAAKRGIRKGLSPHTIDREMFELFDAMRNDDTTR